MMGMRSRGGPARRLRSRRPSHWPRARRRLRSRSRARTTRRRRARRSRRRAPWPGAEGECRVSFEQRELALRGAGREPGRRARSTCSPPTASLGDVHDRPQGEGPAALLVAGQGRKACSSRAIPRGAAIAVSDGAGRGARRRLLGRGRSRGSTSKLRRGSRRPTSRRPAPRRRRASRSARTAARGSRSRSRACRAATTGCSWTAPSVARSRSGALGRGQMEWESDDGGGPTWTSIPAGKLIDVADATGCVHGGLAGSIPGVTTSARSPRTRRRSWRRRPPARGAAAPELRSATTAAATSPSRSRTCRSAPTTSSSAASCAARFRSLDVGGQNRGEIEFTSEPGEVRRAVPRLRARRRRRSRSSRATRSSSR